MRMYFGLMLRWFYAKMFFLGMAVFDSTLTSFNMQDEHAQYNSLNCPGTINANAFEKVKAAFANAFAVPALALA